ncbi:hypothetical protein A9Q84_12415 [Halobacteriovorax marinus]|uniref:Uncharacterized protein n=1 Tax=Halobacteriovorax marinus TaxID=97084 RepID=A0A1Y5F881_9BACT|nr:hypothetical protein A9Q84_12415 [Halobacteriovorax marinus]
MKKKIILILTLILFILAGATYGLLNYNYSNGIRSGRLVKLSKKGALVKTYEGTLDEGSGDQLTWNFSIHDTELGEELVKHTGQKVNLEYRELLYKVFYKTKYDVTSWKLLKTPGSVNFCRLVNIMRKSRFVVEKVKQLINQYDSALLQEARNCQK